MAYQNVIWILTDQLRRSALEPSPDALLPTPNLDLLARTGTSFDNAYSGAPHCCPFRGSLFTSRYPHACVPDNGFPLPNGMQTIADAFSTAGYDTAFFGKWHLGGFIKADNRCRIPKAGRGGFGTWLGYENNNDPFHTVVHGHRGACEVPFTELRGYETDCLADLFIEHLHAVSAPFFAVLSVQPPHPPNLAPAELLGRFSERTVPLPPNVPDASGIASRARRMLAGYAAQIASVDENVGRILACLQQKGVAEQTAVLFFSDHGELGGAHGLFGKTSPYEESAHIPLICAPASLTRQPGAAFGTQSRALINHVDLAPTTLGLCGLPAPAWMQGCDLSAECFKGTPPDTPPASLYMQHIASRIMSRDNIDRGWRGVVTQDGWKYACFAQTPWLLFHLSDDPYEQVNLAWTGRYAAKRRELTRLMLDWQRRTGDAFPLPEEV